ncbi:MAG: hypothetical protein HOM11_06015, partial [Methylococcales bacterium]|nr:hypothetical protein [Methylococcales bacterium]
DIEEYSSLLQKLTEIGKKYDPRHIRFERITSSGFYLRSRIRRSEQQLTMSNILCIQTAPDFELKAVKPREKSDLVELGVFAGFVVYLKII